MQRRHQKLVEEAPAPALPAAVLDAIAETALRGALAVGYVGAGTLEFLVDAEDDVLLHGGQLPDPGRASGDRDGHRHRPGARADCTSPPASRCGWRQAGHPPARRRHGVPDQRRGPRRAASRRPPAGSSGSTLPGGPFVRVDTARPAPATGSRPHYDSLLAKVIVWAPDRE